MSRSSCLNRRSLLRLGAAGAATLAAAAFRLPSALARSGGFAIGEDVEVIVSALTCEADRAPISRC